MDKKIPLNVFLTWNTKKLPYYMKENLMELMRKNQEFKFYFQDDDACRNFIKKNYSNKILNAYDSLIPGAYKADLWRYCILYKYGGIYMDIKLQTEDDFKLINLINEEHFPIDIISDNERPGIWQGFLVCKPKNLILAYCINEICKNVKNKYYGITPLSVTGPELVYKVINYVNKDIYKKSKVRLIRTNNPKIFIAEKDTKFIRLYYENKPIIKFYENYVWERKLNKQLHYSELWHRREIFKS